MRASKRPSWSLRCGLLVLLSCGPPAWSGGIHALLAWSPQGVRVVDVPEGGPADRAGLRADDRMVAIDGKPVAGRTSESVQAALSGDVGSVATIEVLRDGERLTLAIERVPYAAPVDDRDARQGGAR